MTKQIQLGGTFNFPGTTLTVHRVGYGAMQLAGPHVFGPPRDRPEGIAVLREAVAAGVNHIDTSDFYGPHVTNQVINEALHPYPKDLILVTKVGARRSDDGSWILDRSRKNLIESVHDNLRNLGLEALFRDDKKTIPPCVYYSLSSHGRTLGPVVQMMCDWGRWYLKCKSARR
jgi:pyridoxine 4-dehydrogenase